MVESGKKLLIVDDSQELLDLTRYRLFPLGYALFEARDGFQALEIVEAERPDVIIMDIMMPGMSGLDTLRRIKEIDNKVPVIILTAYGSIRTAMEAMSEGAYDYLTKPCDWDKLRRLVTEAGTTRPAAEERPAPQALDVGGGDQIVGTSPQMLEIYKTIGQVAPTDATVLIQGESGAGKEMVARAIYRHSKRRDKSFLAVSCAAIPETLLESELFGHEKEAFTGANTRRIGKFEQADGGTILLDEIGDMSLLLQSKVLRLIEEQSFERLGGNQTISVDVRIIAASNKDLAAEVEAGHFRNDLYYRLRVITIRIPPLREYPTDIAVLAEHFIRRFNQKLGKNIEFPSELLLKALQAYPWPGNVRELENSLETAMIMCKGDALSLDLFPFLHEGRSAAAQAESTTQIERVFHEAVHRVYENARAGHRGELYGYLVSLFEQALFSKVMEEESNNQVKASNLLGISRNTLRDRLAKYGL